MKARDFVELFAPSFPAAQALKILCDDYVCDIVKIGSRFLP